MKIMFNVLLLIKYSVLIWRYQKNKTTVKFQFVGDIKCMAVDRDVFHETNKLFITFSRS